MLVTKSISKIARDYGAIVVYNLVTPIFIITMILVVALFILGQRTDAIFLSSVISFNSIIAVIQEARARYRVNQLSLLQARTVRRLLGESTEIVSFEAVAPGDLLVLEAGDQVLVDGVAVETSSLELNESLLTGEMLAIQPNVGRQLYAGSIVMAGRGVMKVTAVGEQTWAGKLNQQLKASTHRPTPLQRSLNRTISALTVAAVGISAIILINGRLEEHALAATVRTIVTAAISLVPEGLILASSLLLAVCAVKMARKKILVQRLAAVEGFGRLEFLCLDKTGTLTSPLLEFERLEALDERMARQIQQDLGAIVSIGKPSQTVQAIINGLESLAKAELSEEIAFSSSRKYSAVSYVASGGMRWVALGAPDVLAKQLEPKAQARLNSWTASGLRVLLLVAYDAPKTSTLAEAIQAEAKPLAFIVLRAQLRPGIKEVISRLQRDGTLIKVISGDHLSTVQAVAAQAGIKGYKAGLTGSELEHIAPNQWQDAVMRTTVFARVSPEQKLELIKTFQSHGFTGMVGDGVNDALALKHADLGIAMAEGSSAARDVADVVLLNNSFAGVPVATDLGSEFIIRLELIASLFFNRAIYGTIVLVMTLVAGVEFPFLPRQVTMMNWFVVALPSIFWSIQPLTISKRINPKNFFRATLGFAIPNGLLSGIAIGAIYLLSAGHAEAGSPELASASTLAMLAAAALGVAAFLLVPPSLAARGPQLVKRQILASLGVAALVASILSLGGLQLRRFFEIVPVSMLSLAMAATIVFATVGAQYILASKQFVASKFGRP